LLAVRKAAKTDFSTIVEIMRLSATEEELRGFVPAEGVSSGFLEELKRELEREAPDVILAEANGVPVGFAFYTFQEDSVEIEEMDVVKAWQGRGVGRTLVDYIEKVARERGVKRLVTGTSLNSEGEPWRAYGFWTHIGFVDTGERTESPHGIRYVKLIKTLQS